MREVQHVDRDHLRVLPRMAMVPITSTEEDCHAEVYPQGDAFVMTANINGTNVCRILVDGGSSVDLLFLPAFEAMGLSREKLHQGGTTLRGFGARHRSPGPNRAGRHFEPRRTCSVRRHRLRCGGYPLPVQHHLRPTTPQCLLRYPTPRLLMHKDAGPREPLRCSAIRRWPAESRWAELRGNGRSTSWPNTSKNNGKYECKNKVEIISILLLYAKYITMELIRG